MGILMAHAFFPEYCSICAGEGKRVAQTLAHLSTWKRWFILCSDIVVMIMGFLTYVVLNIFVTHICYFLVSLPILEVMLLYGR